MKKLASFYDSNGKLYIDCTECEKGKNGSDSNKCSCGIRVKKPNQGGCFNGYLCMHIDKAKLKQEVKYESIR